METHPDFTKANPEPDAETLRWLDACGIKPILPLPHHVSAVTDELAVYLVRHPRALRFLRWMLRV